MLFLMLRSASNKALKLGDMIEHLGNVSELCSDTISAYSNPVLIQYVPLLFLSPFYSLVSDVLHFRLFLLHRHFFSDLHVSLLLSFTL